MNPRLEAVFATQRASRLPGLAGSDVRARFRIADTLLNEIIAASLPDGGAVRSIVLHAHADNIVDATIDVRKTFVPTVHVQIAIVRQPVLPADPVVAGRLSGGLLKFAAPFLSGLKMPPGIRLDGDLLSVDVAVLLARWGWSAVLEYATELRLVTEEGAVVVEIVGGA